MCTVNRQVSSEELLAENRELKKQLRALKDQLEHRSEAAAHAPPTATPDAPHALKSLQQHWPLVVMGMQMVYLLVVNASLVSH